MLMNPIKVGGQAKEHPLLKTLKSSVQFRAFPLDGKTMQRVQDDGRRGAIPERFESDLGALL
jgi:hypothetical protein